jgi:hypothetical protein
MNEPLIKMFQNIIIEACVSEIPRYLQEVFSQRKNKRSESDDKKYENPPVILQELKQRTLFAIKNGF